MGIMTSLGKLAGEAARALRTFAYERMEDGRIYLPHARASIGGVFRHAHAPAGLVDRFGNPIFGDWAVDPNRMVNTGLDYVLNVAFGSTSKLGAFYLAPYSANVTPAAGWTGANFNANATEFTGYTSATRLPWNTVNSTARSIGNAAALAAATATFSAGGPYDLYGITLISGSVKGATTDSLIAGTRFANSRLGQIAGDKLAFQYDVTAKDEGDVA